MTVVPPATTDAGDVQNGRARNIVESELGLAIRELRPLRWKEGQNTPLYFVEADQGKYVLKMSTPRPRRKAGLREYLARVEIEHQAKVLDALGSCQFEHLRFPRLIASDGRSFLLLEYLELTPHGEHDLPRDQLLESLLEFQTAPIVVPAPLLTTLGRAPGMLVVRRLLGAIRARVGGSAVRRALLATLRSHIQQRRLTTPVVTHNDFHHNNVLLDKEGKLYINDFEYVSRDRRWVLGDIIHYAVGTHEFLVDTGIVLEYADMVRRRLGDELDLAAQFRFNLILRVGHLMISGTPPHAVAHRYERFFREILIDDDAFSEWLRRRVEEGSDGSFR